MRTHLLGDWIDDEDRRRLADELARAGAGDLVWSDGVELPPDAGEVRTLVGGRPTAEQLAACPRLEAVVVPWVGLPPALRSLALDRPGLRVHNLHHNAAATAEAALTLLLAAARRLVPCDRALRAGDWRPRYDDEPSVTLAGRSAVVLGYGAIGRRVARVLAAMDMQVRAVRRTAGDPGEPVMTPAGEPEGEAGVEVVVAGDPASVRAAAAGHHVLMVCLPETPETTGLVDAAMLDGLADPALVVNVGRGPVVDEDALYERLADGRIFGAGIDTWWRYPASEAERAATPPSTRPYGELDSVVLSPHRGGGERREDESRRRMADLATLLADIAAGGRALNRVDPERGY